MSGIYLHIPFCKQACSYCDFYFVTQHHQKKEFVGRLIKEIKSYSDSRFTEEKVETIYFGGGTPSLLEAGEIEQILNAIFQTFDLELKEVTLEMNPDDVTKVYLQDIHAAGINRASMGVQTFNESLLKFMHRAHTSGEALHCLELLANSEFENFTVDLIYGNPDQSLKMLEKDIDQVLKFSPPHVSAYSLTIEPKTRLGKQLELGRLIPAGDEDVAKHFDMISEKLAKAGIQHYEVSNFAKPGKEALHNSAYWNHKNYLGFGPAAHSFWWNENNLSAKRWSNARDMKGYILQERFSNEIEEELDISTLFEEKLMLGLRTVEGVNTFELSKKYDAELSEKQLEYLQMRQKEGKAIVDETGFRLTEEGLKISDAIVLDLISL